VVKAEVVDRAGIAAHRATATGLCYQQCLQTPMASRYGLADAALKTKVASPGTLRVEMKDHDAMARTTPQLFVAVPPPLSSGTRRR